MLWRTKVQSPAMPIVSLQLTFCPLLTYHALFCTKSLCRGDHLGRGRDVLPHVPHTCDVMTGGVITEAEEAQIHRMDETEAGRYLQCRSSGTASSPARRTA